MVARTETYEYARFGAKNVRRPVDSAEPWEDCDAGDVEAEVALRTAEALRAQPMRGLSLKITRSPDNIEIASKLGLTADQLAERLAKADDNRGTGVRVSDGEFNEVMLNIGLDPDEARDRFSGRYWQSPGDGDKSTAKAPGVS